MDISVIVTNFNYGRFLGRCLRSLLSQSLPRANFEIIVVDDASTDDSLEIIKSFRDRITLLQQPSNMGLAHSSNLGILNAKGRYVVRVDSDDYVHSDFLKILLTGFEFFGKECEAVSTDYLCVTPEGLTLEYGSAILNPIACAIAFKMDALESLGFYDSKLRIDEEIDLREKFSAAGYNLRNINLPMYRYVKHKGSLTKSVLI